MLTRHTRRLVTGRAVLIAMVAPAIMLQFGGCLNRDTIFTALSDSLALTAVSAVQGLLAGFIGG